MCVISAVLQVLLAAVFDLLFSQCDRHGQNLYLKPDGSIVLIDNDQVNMTGVICKRGLCKAGVSRVCGWGGGAKVVTQHAGTVCGMPPFWPLSCCKRIALPVAAACATATAAVSAVSVAAVLRSQLAAMWS